MLLTGQFVEDDDVVDEHAFPVGQAVQDPAPSKAYVPGAQGVMVSLDVLEHA